MEKVIAFHHLYGENYRVEPLHAARPIWRHEERFRMTRLRPRSALVYFVEGGAFLHSEAEAASLAARETSSVCRRIQNILGLF